MAKFDPPSYRIYLMNSIISGGNKHILVEGKEDKYLVEKLWKDLLIDKDCDMGFHLIVDSAESLLKDGETSKSLRNREKVESLAVSILGKEYSAGFVGFVDREFDGFSWDCNNTDPLNDHINAHTVADRLVFSRGHSIENYLFDFKVLSEALDLLTTTAYSREALDVFKENFDATLRVACALSLTAAKARVLTASKSSISRDLISIAAPSGVNFLFEEWIQVLKSKSKGIDLDQERALRESFPVYENKVSQASIALVRWICHGHFGYDLLRSTYERAILEVCPSLEIQEKEVSGISWVKKDKLLFSFINSWIKQIVNENFEYPIAIFELLEIYSLRQ
jgi:hypothetical protein